MSVKVAIALLRVDYLQESLYAESALAANGTTA